jgi:hypothetical protein
MGLFGLGKENKAAKRESGLTPAKRAAYVEMAVAWAFRCINTEESPVYDFPAIPDAVRAIIREAVTNHEMDEVEILNAGRGVLEKLGALGIFGGLYVRTAQGPEETEQEQLRVRVFRDEGTDVFHEPLRPEDGVFVAHYPGIEHLVIENSPTGVSHSTSPADLVNPTTALGQGSGLF